VDEAHFEMAAAMELLARETAINKARSAVSQSHVRPDGFDGACPGCSEVIPQQRVDAGYFVCVDCKTEEEARRKQFL